MSMVRVVVLYGHLLAIVEFDYSPCRSTPQMTYLANRHILLEPALCGVTRNVRMHCDQHSIASGVEI